jgi:hypothetical protein
MASEAVPFSWQCLGSTFSKTFLTILFIIILLKNKTKMQVIKNQVFTPPHGIIKVLGGCSLFADG